jgi:hypothetical protein
MNYVSGSNNNCTCAALTHRTLAVEITQADPKAEIAHTQSLQNKNTKAQREAPRSALLGRTAQDTLINDPKHGVTIRLYEDLTNLIVLSAKIQESPYAYLGEIEEITYKCIFSHMNSCEYHLSRRPCTSVLTHYHSESLIPAHIYVPTPSPRCPWPFAFSS